MKVVKVIYQKVFPLAQYVNEKIGIEIELDGMDDENKAFKIAKDTIEKWHKEGNPQLQEVAQPGEAPIPVIHVEKEEKAIGLYVDDIMSCKNIKVLESYVPLIKGNLVMENAYELRRKQLMQNTPF
jgi:hypothetical protein